MSPYEPKSARNAVVVEAAKALIEAVRTQALQAVAGDEQPPQSTLMCVSAIALAAEIADQDAEAPFHGLARALASMAVAQGIGKHQLVSALNAAMAPTFNSRIAQAAMKARRS